MTIQEILEERGESYGSFEDNATVAQNLKSSAASGRKWESMSPDAREAIHMICSKISRLVTGDPNHADSWADIAGYATLVKDRLTES
jgi:hypothetical protein